MSNQFHNPHTNYDVDSLLLNNPNLTPQQRENIMQLGILRRSGFFGDLSYQNGTQSGQIIDSSSQQTMFQINPKDLEIPLDQEVPNAQKIWEVINFRRSNIQNELTYYSFQIAESNVKINSMLVQVYNAVANLRKAQEMINSLSPQISSAQNPQQVANLQQQMNTAVQNSDQQINFIRNSLAQATEIRKQVGQQYDIIKRIAGQNAFGNQDFENSSKAAYDVVLAEESIKRLAAQGESVYASTKQGNSSFVQGTNSLCFVKTGQQFWKNSANEILQDMVNMSSSAGRMLWFVNVNVKGNSLPFNLRSSWTLQLAKLTSHLGFKTVSIRICVNN
jgi:hypothetical protein